VTRLTYPDGFFITYEYNAQGLLERIPGVVEHVDYNAASQRTAVAYANNAVTSYAYDKRLRLEELRTSAGQRLLQSLSYQFDQASNILSITDVRPDRTAANDQTQSFQYDALYRLIRSSGAYGQIDHAYNSIGNMVRQTSTAADSRLQLGEMRYGDHGAGPHALTSAGGQGYSYDANGNRSGKGSMTYAWNPRDWLISVRDGEAVSNYAYDASGQRIRQTVQQGALITRTLYADQVAEVRGNEFMRYVFDDQKRIAQMAVPFAPSQLLTGFRDSIPGTNTPPATTRWYVADHLGGTSLLTDGAAQIIAEVGYYPYGLTRYELNAGEIHYLFTGKELDNSSLYYFGARYYDLILARFVSVDPSAVQDNPSYAYANNNPLKYVDPTGRDAQNRIQQARALVKPQPLYKQENAALRTEKTPEALKYMDCSELVSRVLAADGLTEKVENMNTVELKSFLATSGKYEHSLTGPKEGDIAVWEEHVGIVSGVAGEKFKMIHATGHVRDRVTKEYVLDAAGNRIPRPARENKNPISANEYRPGSKFYGFYRPIVEPSNTSGGAAGAAAATDGDSDQRQTGTSTAP
jgi:RHS repeat-associated protein